MEHIRFDRTGMLLIIQEFSSSADSLRNKDRMQRDILSLI